MKPVISIVLAVYNGEKFLKESIDSVLNQSYANFELIIINDGSFDSTQNIIDSYSDERIICFKLNHRGLSQALNFGIEKSRGDYIARIDDDDIWFKDKLNVQMKYLVDHPEIEFLATAKQVIDENGMILVTSEPERDLDYYELRSKLLENNIICHSSVLFKRSIIYHTGTYNTNFKNSLDYEYWIRILDNHQGHLIGVPMVKYRISSKMLSIVKRYEQNLEVVRIKLKLFKRNRIKIIHLKFFILDIYRLLIPDFLIKFKKRVFKML
jgi:glycosyltransferase involved in cell wall biosynthesis